MPAGASRDVAQYPCAPYMHASMPGCLFQKRRRRAGDHAHKHAGGTRQGSAALTTHHSAWLRHSDHAIRRIARFQQDLHVRAGRPWRCVNCSAQPPRSSGWGLHARMVLGGGRRFSERFRLSLHSLARHFVHEDMTQSMICTCDSWVVLPLPVSPMTTTHLLLVTASRMSPAYRRMGSCAVLPLA